MSSTMYTEKTFCPANTIMMLDYLPPYVCTMSRDEELLKAEDGVEEMVKRVESLKIHFWNLQTNERREISPEYYMHGCDALRQAGSRFVTSGLKMRKCDAVTSIRFLREYPKFISRQAIHIHDRETGEEIKVIHDAKVLHLFRPESEEETQTKIIGVWDDRSAGDDWEGPSLCAWDLNGSLLYKRPLLPYPAYDPDNGRFFVFHSESTVSCLDFVTNKETIEEAIVPSQWKKLDPQIIVHSTSTICVIWSPEKDSDGEERPFYSVSDLETLALNTPRLRPKARDLLFGFPWGVALSDSVLFIGYEKGFVSRIESKDDQEESKYLSDSAITSLFVEGDILLAAMAGGEELHLCDSKTLTSLAKFEVPIFILSDPIFQDSVMCCLDSRSTLRVMDFRATLFQTEKQVAPTPSEDDSSRPPEP